MIQLSEVRDACELALLEPGLQVVTDAFKATPLDPVAELERVTFHPDSASHIAARAQSAGVEECNVSRWLLLRTALVKIPLLRVWPVVDPVREFWASDVLFYARPTGNPAIFSPNHARFREMARIVTLRRHPAGQFHWEISGMPRTWVLRTPLHQWPRLLASLAMKIGGFAPMAEIHVNDRRKNRLTLNEPEGLWSLYLMAQSIALQPEILGMVTASWLYCSSTAVVSPRLAWLRRFFLENGALLGSIGPAPEDSGFLVGGNERRALYESGAYRPAMTFVLWPRRSLLFWAERYSPDRTLGV